ncbi:hypothetical protein [Gimesia sp.]|uniref:hypothetical protein n=1 Tax=Gimesia sp. TaxID=2024833 RepID=UPI000C62E149|nr:hypothetical protein [Gimesia sp.]MAX35927.1 hypothetical protein [Gimesia sp.]HBL45212.1 hypothetical protein [Planctomycetaceae bacterium]|tara:strand:- start:4251 stop:5933 length:1683 start_codon:yes stop_codon:yes gene_type:complete
MSSALIATTKSFCKRAWPSASIAVATLVIVPLMINILMRLQGLTIPYSDQEIFSLHFTYLGISWIIFLTITVRALAGSQKYCRGLPISSRAIATWLMLAMVGLVVVLQLATNGAYRALFFDERWLSDYWPVLGPVLFLVTLVLTGHAIFWTLNAPSYTRIILSMAIIVALFWWFLSRYFPQGFKAEAVPWSHVTLGEFVLMQLVSLAAWYQGTRAFAGVRSGTAVPSPQWTQTRNWWDSLTTGASSSGQTGLISHRAALARLHWRDGCQRAVIMGGGLSGVAVLVLNTTMRNGNGSHPINITEGFLQIYLMFSIIAALVVGLIVGEGTCGPGRTEMKGFLAVTPLSDRDFAVALFGNMVKTVLYSSLLIQAGLMLNMMAFVAPGMLQGDQASIIISRVALYWFVYSVNTLACFWTIAANVISVFWTGRSWFYYLVIGSIIGCFGLFVFIVNFTDRFFYSRNINYLQMAFFLVLALLIFIGVVTAFITACRRGLVKVSTARIVGGLWLIGSLAAIWLKFPSMKGREEMMAFCLYVFLLSLYALAFAPFATIPLALSWNRHR